MWLVWGSETADVDELIEQRALGATIMELAACFKIHRTTVMAHLRRRGALSR